MLRPSHVIWALGPIDVKSIRRDPMLRWLVVYPIAIALGARWGVPALANWLEERFAFDLTTYYTLVMSVVVLAVPGITGAVIGFLLLDQRDDRTLTALQVTPLTLTGYLVYRTMLPIVLSVAMTMLVVPVAGLVTMGFVEVLLAALEAGPLAPLYALFLGAFAANKVQGFALAKAAGILAWPPVFAYFVSSQWQWAFGVVPLYWPAKLFWMLEAGEAGTWLYFVIGLVYQSLLLALLLRRFNKVLYRQ